MFNAPTTVLSVGHSGLPRRRIQARRDEYSMTRCQVDQKPDSAIIYVMEFRL